MYISDQLTYFMKWRMLDQNCILNEKDDLHAVWRLFRSKTFSFGRLAHLEWPILWCITKTSLHNEGISK